MKRCLLLLLSLYMLIAAVFGCAGKNDSSSGSEDNGDKQNLYGDSEREIDVDLTVLSSTMVYGEVYQITTSPEDYLGKAIKMSGVYYSTYFDVTGLFYHYVVIEDAAACCAQGIEFVLSSDADYPDDYPLQESVIELVGVYDSYEELGDTWYCLVVDDIIIRQ